MMPINLLALYEYQRNMLIVGSITDEIEMEARRTMLLFHGVPQLRYEDTTNVVLDILRNRLNMFDFPANLLKLCVRMGKPVLRCIPKTILVEFEYVYVRDMIYQKRFELGRSGITITEFLTKKRYTLYKEARLRFGMQNCWTAQGNIYVHCNMSNRNRVLAMNDLIYWYIGNPEYFEDSDTE